MTFETKSTEVFGIIVYSQRKVMEKKVYDYNPGKVKNQILTALKKRKNASTVADLLSETALPAFQVNETIREIVDEYGGHMKVTASGEVLYYFPQGLRSRYRGPGIAMKRFFQKFLSLSIRVLTFLFKVWIMVMLVGYFILFIALLVFAFVASIAVSTASRGEGGGGRGRGRGGFGSFYLTTMVFDLFIRLIFYSSLSKAHKKRGKKRPLHISVFAYVFGSPNPNANWEEREAQEVIAYIQSHKGTITNTELQTLTGLDSESTQLFMNHLCLKFEGEPKVSENGSLFFQFPSLMMTTDRPRRPESIRGMDKKIIPFSNNKSSTNKWITFFNAVNLIFGTYFFSYSYLVDQIQATDGFALLYIYTGRLLLNITQNPVPVLGIGLGVVPLLFAFFFYLTPLLRRMKDRRENQRVQERNFRRKIYRKVLERPEELDINTVLPAGKEEAPPNWEEFRQKTIDQLAAEKEGEIAQAEGKDGVAYVYSFPGINREAIDMAEIRRKTDTSTFELGETVFDSKQ